MGCVPHDVIDSLFNVCVCVCTFQVRRPHGGHGGGRGLAEALEGGLLPGGVVRGAVLLLLLLLVGADGLQRQLFPARDNGGGSASMKVGHGAAA